MPSDHRPVDPLRPRTATVRVRPLPASEWTDAQREVLDRIDVENSDSLNLFTTLARHPRLLRHWIPFAGSLLMRSTLTPRERELLIMRTSAVVGVPYEWVAHVSISRGLGFGPTELDALQVGPDAPSWTPEESTLLSSVDELVGTGVISGTTWDRLRAGHDEQQLIEIPMLVGAYVMLGYVVNSLGVEPDAGEVTVGERAPRTSDDHG
ncbi:carboxymuconolactone decarboxylase family protein [Nocardioides humi]|uniref:Carboxymuconolactone decarboxylase family protein n=1 Tax=Nocardioides humi TaxID=449461 RepID=A0ABN2BQ17_9ACTN|nr:carboxymuconolactone decarboxylase family protein [Nocardioides humi]